MDDSKLVVRKACPLKDDQRDLCMGNGCAWWCQGSEECAALALVNLTEQLVGRVEAVLRNLG